MIVEHGELQNTPSQSAQEHRTGANLAQSLRTSSDPELTAAMAYFGSVLVLCQSGISPHSSEPSPVETMARCWALFLDGPQAAHLAALVETCRSQIGRASCRERGCQSVYIQVVAESLK